MSDKIKALREAIDTLVSEELDSVLANTDGGAPSNEKSDRLKRDLEAAKRGVDDALSALTNTSGDDEAPVARVDDILDLYRMSVQTDVTMEGVHFMGVNRSALKRAWEADRAALARPQSAAVRDEALPEKPDYKVLKAIAWMKVDPGSRAFEDTKGELEVIGYKRAEQIYAAIRAAIHSTQEG